MGRVVRLLTYYGEVDVVAILHGILVRPVLLVATHMRVSGVLTGHNGSSRRCRYGRTGVCLSEAHALACHAVDVGRRDIGLSIACKVAISHVVAQYKYDVGACRVVGLSGLCCLSRKQRWHASNACRG